MQFTNLHPTLQYLTITFFFTISKLNISARTQIESAQSGWFVYVRCCCWIKLYNINDSNVFLWVINLKACIMQNSRSHPHYQRVNPFLQVDAPDSMCGCKNPHFLKQRFPDVQPVPVDLYLCEYLTFLCISVLDVCWKYHRDKSGFK